MSIQAIKEYQSEVEKSMHFGGSKKETAIRNAFYNLLNEYAKQKGLMLVPEITIKTTKGKNVTPDGTLKDSLRQDWGYWESYSELIPNEKHMESKAETFTIEGYNSRIRHYLARFKRKSKCYSKSEHMVEKTLKLLFLKLNNELYILD